MTEPFRFACSAFLAAALSVTASPSEANGPVMDYDSVLTNTVVVGGSLVPGISPMSPGKYRAAFANGQVRALITKRGSTEPLHTHSYDVIATKGVFSDLRATSYTGLPLEQMGEGDFTLTFYSGETPMTAMDFSVASRKAGDAFNPKVETVLEGDWSDWAMLRIPFGLGDRDDATAGHAIQLVHWTQFGRADRGEGTALRAEIRFGGEVVAEDAYATCKINATWPRCEYDLVLPEGLKDKRFEVTHLLARDGVYDVIFKEGDTVLSRFQFEVRDGKEVYHPRQDASYEPRTEYLIPRQYELSGHNASISYGYDVVWMEAASTD